MPGCGPVRVAAPQAGRPRAQSGRKGDGGATRTARGPQAVDAVSLVQRHMRYEAPEEQINEEEMVCAVRWWCGGRWGIGLSQVPDMCGKGVGGGGGGSCNANESGPK